MEASSGSAVVLVLIFAALILLTLFLFVKRGSKGVFGNRFFLFGALIALVIFFVIARVPMIGYYQSIFKEAPYSFSELRSIVFKYGEKDKLLNQYNSATGEYQYLNKKDSLVKTEVNFTATDMLYLHRKAAELGFWDFPSNEVSKDTTRFAGAKPLRYYIEFNYKEKSKKVTFDVDFDGNVQLKEANLRLIDEIMHVLSDARDRQKK